LSKRFVARSTSLRVIERVLVERAEREVLGLRELVLRVELRDFVRAAGFFAGGIVDLQSLS
jgi:hypothetical protein